MSLLHSGIFWIFLPLVAIPIVLHLLTLQRLKTVELSTFRFLFDSYVQQRRRMKFLEVLIAMLRTLFLLFLIFCISRPVVKHWDALFGGSGSGRDIVMLVDCSASMDAVTDGETALARAKLAALKVVDRLSSDDRVTVLRVGAKPEEVCHRYSSDTEAIRSGIESLSVTPSRANLFASFSEVFGSQTRALVRPLVYLFSDLQSSGWDEFEDGANESLVPDETELIVVNVGSKQQLSNLAVVGKAPDARSVIVGLPITLLPKVANYSESETQDAVVSILIDEKEIARKNFSIKPGETAEAEVIFTPREPGLLRGRYEIAVDRFGGDDTFLFALNVAPRVKVLLVNGNPSAEPLENEGLYLRTAMMATDRQRDRLGEIPVPVGKTETDNAESKGSETDEAADVDDQFVRSLEVIDIPEGNLNEETLRDVDVVILANCGGLDPIRFYLVSAFVAGGGGLLVLPGDKVNKDAYNEHFLPAPEVPDEHLVTATLGEMEGDLDQSESFLRLESIDFAHPIFSVFADRPRRYMTNVQIYRRFLIQLDQATGSSWPLALLSNGTPAIVEGHYGNGRVLLTAFPLNTRWGNLPLKPEFVPLVLQMIRHVKRRADLEGPSVVAADRSAEFVISPSWAPASGKVTDIAGRITPVAFERTNSQLMGVFQRTREKGYYTVQISGGNTEQPKQGALSFAVNLDAGESNLTSLTGPQVEKMLPTARVTSVDASAEAQQLYGSIGNEREIWRPLIFLLFVIMGMEFLLSTLGGHIDQNQGQTTKIQRLRNFARGRWVGQIPETVE